MVYQRTLEIIVTIRLLTNLEVFEAFNIFNAMQDSDFGGMLFKIGNTVILYADVIAKSKHIYNYIIPEKFRPKETVTLYAQNLSSPTVGVAILAISPNGQISTENDYPAVLCSGMTMWNVNKTNNY